MNQPVEPLHDDVRQAFESILARAPEPGPLLVLEPLPLATRVPRRHRTLVAAVAAALALVCGTVAWVVAGRSGDGAPVGEPGQLVITDPTAISLDALPRQARVPGEFVVLDAERLPEGWELDSQSGRSDYALAGAYSYAARLSGPAGEQVTLVVELGMGSVEARLGEGSGPSAVVEVNGQPALQWTNEVRWMTTDGAEVAVLGAVRRAIVSVVSTGSPLSAVDLLDLARSLPLTVEAQLPPPSVPSTTTATSTGTTDPAVETTTTAVQPAPVAPPAFPDETDAPMDPLGDGVYVGTVNLEGFGPEELAVLPLTLSRLVTGEACYELPVEVTDGCSNDYSLIEPRLDVSMTFSHETEFSVAQGPSQSFAVTGPDLVRAYRSTATGNYSPVVPGLPTDAAFSPHLLLITVRDGFPVR